MREWFFTLAFPRKDIREIHKVSEIMNSPSRNDCTFFCKRQTFDQKFQKIHIHFLVIDKTYKFSLPPVFKSLFNFLHQGCREVMVYIYFRVFGYFKNPGPVTFIAKIAENV